jgi:hypothetical protein
MQVGEGEPAAQSGSGPCQGGSKLKNILRKQEGRAIAQEIGRRLLTVVAQVPARVKSCGICGGQSSTGAGLLRVFGFPIAKHHPPSPGSGTIGQ